MKTDKPVKMWCVQWPDGHLTTSTHFSKQWAIEEFLKNKTASWKVFQKEGYKCVEIEVVKK